MITINCFEVVLSVEVKITTKAAYFASIECSGLHKQRTRKAYYIQAIFGCVDDYFWTFMCDQELKNSMFIPYRLRLHWLKHFVVVVELEEFQRQDY